MHTPRAYWNLSSTPKTPPQAPLKLRPLRLELEATTQQPSPGSSPDPLCSSPTIRRLKVCHSTSTTARARKTRPLHRRRRAKQTELPNPFVGSPKHIQSSTSPRHTSANTGKTDVRRNLLQALRDAATDARGLKGVGQTSQSSITLGIENSIEDGPRQATGESAGQTSG